MNRSVENVVAEVRYRLEDLYLSYDITNLKHSKFSNTFNHTARSALRNEKRTEHAKPTRKQANPKTPFPAPEL